MVVFLTIRNILMDFGASDEPEAISLIIMAPFDVDPGFCLPFTTELIPPVLIVEFNFKITIMSTSSSVGLWLPISFILIWPF